MIFLSHMIQEGDWLSRRFSFVSYMVVGTAVISKASVHVWKLALLHWTAAVAVDQNT